MKNKNLVPSFGDFLNESKQYNGVLTKKDFEDLEGMEVDVQKTEIFVIIPSSEFGSRSQWEKQCKSFAKGQNDMIWEPVSGALDEVGIENVDWESGVFDNREETVNFKLTK